MQFWGGTVAVREGFLLEVPSKQRPETMSRMNQNISHVAWGKLKSVWWYINQGFPEKKRRERL